MQSDGDARAGAGMEAEDLNIMPRCADARAKRCIFVGSPLQGTNLANPAKLRSSLHLLASYGRALGTVGIAAGFLALPMTIIKVASSVVDFTAKTPLLDAALAMIPGLGAQSAISNNQELLRLNARKSPGLGAPAHFYIGANYASKDVASEDRHHDYWAV